MSAAAMPVGGLPPQDAVQTTEDEIVRRRLGRTEAVQVKKIIDTVQQEEEEEEEGMKKR